MKPFRAEEELRRREKFDGVIEMACAVCHELNQSLQTIMGNTEILLMENVDPQGMKKRVNLIKEQINHMEKITRKIIDIADYETIGLPPRDSDPHR